MSRTASSSPTAPLPRRQFLGRVLAFFTSTALLRRADRTEADVQGGPSPYMAEIRQFSCDVVPRGWARCDGQLLPINQNQALFSLLGTQYGGNGFNNFALPDLRGRVAIHQGQGPGLSQRTVGDHAGTELQPLVLAEMPAHTHVARASSAVGDSASPAGMVPARNAAQVPQYGAVADTLMNSISSAGGGQGHENMQPFLAVNYFIAIQGIYPSH